MLLLLTWGIKEDGTPVRVRVPVISAGTTTVPDGESTKVRVISPEEVTPATDSFLKVMSC